MSQPRVTVIICAHNAGSLLSDALESIRRQTYANLEILVVDDGSTDGAVDALRDTMDDGRVRWLRQEQAGKAAALNHALQHASGEFYGIQDADDLSHPRRIELQAAALAEAPDLAAAFCGHELIIGRRRLAPRFSGKDRVACRRDIDAFRMPAHDPTVMYRRALVADIEYEPALRIGQGFDHILRVGERHPMIVLGECLYSYRVARRSNTTRSVELREEMVREVMRRACRRRGLPLPDTTRLPRGRNRRSDNNLAAHFMESALDQARNGRRVEAIRTGFQCVALHPVDPHYYKALAYATLPMPLVKRMRRTVGADS